MPPAGAPRWRSLVHLTSELKAAVKWLSLSLCGFCLFYERLLLMPRTKDSVGKFAVITPVGWRFLLGLLGGNRLARDHPTPVPTVWDVYYRRVANCQQSGANFENAYRVAVALSDVACSPCPCRRPGLQRTLPLGRRTNGGRKRKGMRIGKRG